MMGKLKLLILAMATIIALVLIITQYTASINQTNALQSTYVSVIEIDSVMLKLIRLEKDFQLQKKQGFSSTFNETYKDLDKKLKDLEVKFKAQTFDAGPLRRAMFHFREYHNVFNQLVQVQAKIGYTTEDGFWKKLNESALVIEEELRELNNDMLLAHYWSIRRHEQEFLSLLSLDFQKQLSSRVQLFEYAILEQDISSETAERIKSQLVHYENRFNALVNAHQKLGLNHQSGFRGKLKETEHKTELALSDILEILRNTLKEHIKSEQIRSVWHSALLTLIIAILIILMLMALKSEKKKSEELKEVINNY